MKKEKFQVWEGVFNSFDETKNVTSEVHDDNIWSEKLTKRLEDNLKKFNSTDFVNPLTENFDYPLYSLASTIKDNPINVLDFGGGLGIDYFKLKKHLVNKKINYNIVETDIIVEKGNELLSNINELRFHNKIPEINNLHCCHIAGTIHYVDMWQDLLKGLLKNQPKYLSLANVPAGEIPTFVSTQIYYEKKIPMRFFNVHEFIEGIEELGYKLIFKSLYNGKICGEFGEIPNQKLPESHRIKFACNFVFEKS